MRPGFFICICPDPEIIKDFIDSTLKGFSGRWEKKTLWGDEDVLSSFFNCFFSSSLLGTKQAIVLRHAEKLPKNFWDKLSRFLNRFYSDLCPFICIESQWNRGRCPNIKFLENKKYYKFARKKKWVFEHPGVTEGFLKNYLKKWAKEKRINLSPEVFYGLLEILPEDFASIKNELRKLELSAENNVTSKDLGIIFPSFKYNVFEIIDSIECISPPDKIWSIVLKKEINSIDVILPIFSLLLREARIFWQLLHNEPVNLPSWIKDKKYLIAQKLGIKGVIKMYDIIIDADLKLKTSNINPAILFENVVIELQNLFK